MIAFTCPHCGQPLDVADEYGGQTATCERCGRLVTVPSLRAGASGTVASLKTLRKVVWAFGLLVVTLPLLLLLSASWWRGNWSKYEFRAKPRPARSAPAPGTSAPSVPAAPAGAPRAQRAPGVPDSAAQRPTVPQPSRRAPRVAPAPEPPPVAEPVAERDPTTVLVWIGAAGNTYHKEGCPRLGEDGQLISLEEARAQGRNACTRCYGE